MFYFNPMAFLELLAVLLCWALAVVLFRVKTGGSTARMLAWLLVVEGITLFTSGIWFGFIKPEVGNLWFENPDQFPLPHKLDAANGIIHTIGDCLMLALYPSFLAAALNTKLTRPFGTKPMRIAAAVLAVLLFLVIAFASKDVGTITLFATLTILFGFALVAAIHAWYTAPEGAGRSRAGVFALAFGVRDLCWGFVYLSGIYRILIGIYGTGADPDYVYSIYRLSTLVYVPILAYGILHNQLFDIDLKIRWAIKQSTFAALVIGIVFILSEGAEFIISAELGEAWGLVAAAVALLFIKPLQAFAERCVSILMPNIKNTPEYRDNRKLEVYEAAFEEAIREGGISAKERTLLNHLRDSLAISEADANAIERRLEQTLPASPSFA
jgi:hypothetical protein